MPWAKQCIGARGPTDMKYSKICMASEISPIDLLVLQKNITESMFKLKKLTAVSQCAQALRKPHPLQVTILNKMSV